MKVRRRASVGWWWGILACLLGIVASTSMTKSLEVLAFTTTPTVAAFIRKYPVIGGSITLDRQVSSPPPPVFVQLRRQRLLTKKGEDAAIVLEETKAENGTESAEAYKILVWQKPTGPISNSDETKIVHEKINKVESETNGADRKEPYRVLVWKQSSEGKSGDGADKNSGSASAAEEVLQSTPINGDSHSESLATVKPPKRAPLAVISKAGLEKGDDDDEQSSQKDSETTPAVEVSAASGDTPDGDLHHLAIVAPELLESPAPDPTTTQPAAPLAADDATTSTTTRRPKVPIKEVKVTVIPPTAFNVVLTHATADFDSLASAVGLAKLWTAQEGRQVQPSSTTNSSSQQQFSKNFRSASHVPTFVVLPRGAHPGVQRFLALHKHLFPIRSLKSLPDDLSGLNRLALVDAQRRDRLGPAEGLIEHAKRIVVVDHHVDQDSDIPATDYVVDKVGSVSTLVSEYLKEDGLIELSEAEATLLALGIHADTGSLCFDSTTPRDARALAWCLEQGASQAAIAEHAQTKLSNDQQSVLTQALINVNSTRVHGITLSTVLLSADGFINGLAAVTQDALELSSSDIFLMGMVYEAQSGGRRRRRQQSSGGQLLTSRLLTKQNEVAKPDAAEADLSMAYTDAWKGGKEAMHRRQLKRAFDRKDIDGSGYLDREEISAALAFCGVIASEEAVSDLMSRMDTDGDGKVDFEEFVAFAKDAETRQLQQTQSNKKTATTLILVGRVKAGVSLKAVKLNKLFEKFGGGGHAKAASCTVRLNEPAEAADILQGLVEELVETSLQEQPTVGDFMTAPALSIKSNMNEKQVEDLFTRYDVRALPVVDEKNEVIGLVTYKEVASAKQRLWNKEQKRLRREQEVQKRNQTLSSAEKRTIRDRRGSGTTVKAWMKQHVRTVEASKTMAQVESILLENDVGCIPVVADGTNQLVGLVTRTDLLRQHRYYASLHYHNKGFADSIANRRPIIELRRRLKKFDDLDA